jgi:hypothetical protein
MVSQVNPLSRKILKSINNEGSMSTRPLLLNERSSSPQFTSVPREQERDKSHLGKPLSIWERVALVVSQPTYRISEAVMRARYAPMGPGVWGNCDNQFLERLRRIGTIYGNAHFDKLHPFADIYGFGLTSMPFHATAGLLNYIGNQLDPKDYAYISGKASESTHFTEPKIMTLNACMFWGGQPIAQGGPRPARERIDQLCKKVSEVDPDIFVSQEMSLDPAVKVIDKLKDKYAHFYTNIGPYPWKMDSCLFVASKLPIISAPEFHPFPNQTRVKRGFFCFETPKFWVITTHLQALKSARPQQLAQITAKIDELTEKTGKPCIFLGDLNIPLSSDEHGEYVTSGLRDAYINNYVKGKDPFELTPQNATWLGLVDEYAGSPEPYLVDGKRVYWEVDDYALIRRGQEKKFSSFEVDILPVIELDENDQLADPANALTDHQGLLVSCKINDPVDDENEIRKGELK